MRQLFGLFLKISLRISIAALLAAFLLPKSSPAQQTPPAIEWQKSLGGSGLDNAYSITQTSDGGYIVAGSSTSSDGDVRGHRGLVDAWIVKLTSAGAIQWQKPLGGSDHDYAYSIQQTSNGGYIIAGMSYSTDGDVSGNHGFSDCWIMQLTSAGGIEWQKSLGGSGSEEATSIQQTSDGGYIAAGWSQSTDGDVSGNHGSTDSSDDYWIVKLTSGGEMEWQKSLGGSNYDRASSIAQTRDGGYVVAGWSLSNDGDVTGHHGSADSSDSWIVKLTSGGEMEWQKSLGGSYPDYANSIVQTRDGGYIVAGWSQSNNGDVSGHHGSADSTDAWIVKLTDAGVIQWQRSLGGGSDDYANSVEQTTEGGDIVAGWSSSIDGDVTGRRG